MNTEIKLNLGAGFRQIDGFINIDNRQECEPDLICDVMAGLPFSDNSVDYVLANDFLEHIPVGETVGVIEEIFRVLKPGGTFESMTPSTADPTHRSFWNKCSWLYFMVDEYRHLYGIKAQFTGQVNDYITNDALHIIHTHALLQAVK